MTLEAISAPLLIKARTYAGFGGNYRSGTWLPVVVTFNNEDKHFKGTLKAALNPGSEYSSQTTLDIEIPKGSFNKRFELSILARANDNFAGNRLEITLYHKNGMLADMEIPDPKDVGADMLTQEELDYQKPIKLKRTYIRRLPITCNGAPRSVPWVGQIGVGPGILRPYQVDNKSYRFCNYVRLNAEELPWRARNLNAFRVLLLPRPLVKNIAQPAQEALKEWVCSGGHLVIVLGDFAYLARQGFWNEMIGYKVGDVSQKDQIKIAGKSLHSGNTGASFSVAHIIAPASAVVAGSVDEPLIVRRPMGQGRVTTLAFSPYPYPTGAKPSQEFWCKLLGMSTDPIKRMDWNKDSFNIDLKSLTPPFPKVPMGGIAILVVLLGLVVGPFDYMIIRLLKRPMFTWLSYSGYVLLFSAATLYYAHSIHSSILTVGESSLVMVSNGETRAHVCSMLGVYSTSNNNYTLSVDSPSYSVFPINLIRDGNVSSHPTSVAFDMKSGKPGECPVTMPLTQWSRTGFIADWSEELRGPLTVELKTVGNSVYGKANNLSGLELGDAALYCNNHMLCSFTFSKAGEQAEFVFSTIQSQQGKRNPQNLLSSNAQVLHIARDVLIKNKKSVDYAFQRMFGAIGPVHDRYWLIAPIKNYQRRVRVNGHAGVSHKGVESFLVCAIQVKPTLAGE
jgi:hypothetical protein